MESTYGNGGVGALTERGQFFQVGIVVHDLDTAMEELTRMSGLTWGDPRSRTMGPWDYRLVFSRQGPPHVELIEASEGSPWNPSPDGSMHIDHLQWWSPDLDADTHRLEDDGATVDFDGTAYGHPFRYFRLASGLRVELIEDRDGSRIAEYRSRWGIE